MTKRTASPTLLQTTAPMSFICLASLTDWRVQELFLQLKHVVYTYNCFKNSRDLQRSCIACILEEPVIESWGNMVVFL